MRSAKKRLEEVTMEIQSIDQQLSDARVDTAENSRTQKKQELIDNLKRMFSGVVSPWNFGLVFCVTEI